MGESRPFIVTVYAGATVFSRRTVFILLGATIAQNNGRTSGVNG